MDDAEGEGTVGDGCGGGKGGKVDCWGVVEAAG